MEFPNESEGPGCYVGGSCGISPYYLFCHIAKTIDHDENSVYLDLEGFELAKGSLFHSLGPRTDLAIIHITDQLITENSLLVIPGN